MSPQGQPVHVNSATAIIGPTGSGKSSLIATAAEYLADTYPGQVLALYTSDGGGFPTKIQSLVKLGIIWIWRLRTRGEAFETCIQASKGWWPSAIIPSTGETRPHVRLVPPITERYTMKCPEGHVVKVVSAQSLLTPAVCPGCRTQITRDKMLVEREAYRSKGFEKIGAVAFDGMTSNLNWMMADMARRHANMELKGEDTALGGRIQSGELFLGGNNRAHYGFVQSRAEEMVGNSLSIPYLKLPPIWTGLMLETVDEGNLSIRGMKLAGKAKTDEAAAWFGNMLEVGVVKDEEGRDVRRLTLSEYTDEHGARHLLKHRGSPNMPQYLQDPHDQPYSQVNLGVFFQLLEKDIEANLTEAQGKYQDAEGVPEGEVTFGEVPAAAAAKAEPTLATPAAGKPAPRPAGRPAARGPVRRTTAPAPAEPAKVEEPAVEAPEAETTAVPAEADVPPEPTADAAEPSSPEPEAQEDPGPIPTETPVTPAPPVVRAASAPRPAPRPVAAAGTKPYAPPPAPRPPARAPRVPGLLPRKP